MSKFWKTWLDLWCLGVALFGALLSAGAFAATREPVALLLQTLGGEAIAFDRPLRFSLAVMGAVSIGWSVTLYGLVQVACRGGDTSSSLWRWMLVSALLWFVIDSALSLATGFGLNLVPNIVLLAFLLVPVLRLRLLHNHQP